MYRALSFAALLLGGTVPARSAPPLPVVEYLDLDRYVGTWYEIARYPNLFERNCASDVIAHYARNPDGTIGAVNTCRNEDGTSIRAEVVARVSAPGKLEVRFAPAWLAWLPLVWGDYWVMEHRAVTRSTVRANTPPVDVYPLTVALALLDGRCCFDQRLSCRPT